MTRLVSYVLVAAVTMNSMAATPVAATSAVGQPGADVQPGRRPLQTANSKQQPAPVEPVAPILYSPAPAVINYAPSAPVQVNAPASTSAAASECHRSFLPMVRSSSPALTKAALATAFQINLDTNCLVIGQGGLGPVQVSVSGTAALSTPVVLFMQGVPAGMLASFTVPTATQTHPGSVVLAAGYAITPGTYSLLVSGAASGVTQTQMLLLIVRAQTISTGTVTISRTSPVKADVDVNVTRPTIIDFSGPLSSTTVTSASIFAQFGGITLSARLNLSPDHQRVTLFYSPTLPASSRVLVTVDGSVLRDLNGLVVDAAGNGTPGSVGTFDFDTLSQTTLTGTQVCGRVFASQLVTASNAPTQSLNLPLPGVRISVDATPLSITTDLNGNFCLNPAPVGRFFVHIDGRTATTGTTAGAYYPYLGKAWNSSAGQIVSVGDFFLPLVPTGTLQATSLVSDTLVRFAPSVIQQFPDYANVSLLVPADAPYNNDGTRGFKVGIAPVPPDRMPGSLPAWLRFPIVITVQSDGATRFDRPVGACFPNLPDPTTGVPVPPGGQSWLYSFNHDTGAFEPVGPMTASADGKVVCTDPGVGIPAPGWHGSGPTPLGPSGPACGGDASGGGVGGPGGGPAPLPFMLSPTDKKHDDCIRNATENQLSCQDEHAFVYGASTAACLGAAAVSTVFSPATFGVCMAGVTAQFAIKSAFCQRKYAREKAKCDNPSTACISGPGPAIGLLNKPQNMGMQPSGNSIPLGASLVQTATVDPIANAIISKADEIFALLNPYIAAGQIMPLAVFSQALVLISQTNQLAGGNATQYMQNHVLQLEQDNAPLKAILGETDGNAPPYPVPYMAEIMRPGGVTLRQRGLTQAYGQYKIFVPSDGQLLFVSFYNAKTHAYGIALPYMTPSAPYRLPRMTLVPVDASYPDSDNDGLPDAVEFVYGTNPNNPDTDGDGIPDGAEVDQGTNPLDGLPTITGIIGASATPGYAIDVCAQNDIAAVADSDKGVSVFNVFNRMNPTIIAQVSTAGIAKAVACSDKWIAVADNTAGLALINIANPPLAKVNREIGFNGAARAVAIAGGVAYVGLDNGQVAGIDMASGTLLQQLTVAAQPVQDIAVDGDYLYVLTSSGLTGGTLSAVSLKTFTVTSTAVSAGGVSIRRLRLFVGGGIAYATHPYGYNTFNLTNPAYPVLITHGINTQAGWKQIVPNGSWLGVAAVGANPNSGPQDINLYDVSNPAVTNAYLTTIPMPGLAEALSIYNGLAYVADGAAGLAVLNYQAYDALGKPPTITLSSNFAPGLAEEGKEMRVTAIVSDDVQVRNVEFYVDGVKVSTDGSFPFGFRFVTPLRTQELSFTLQAKATDTGGNFTWTPLMTNTLTADATPPVVNSVTPFGGGKVVNTLFAYFSEPISATTLTTATFSLVNAGLDGVLGTPDDAAAPGGALSYRSDIIAASLAFTSALPYGLYQAVISSTVTDLAGNGLAAPKTWTFRVADGVFWTYPASGDWANPSNWSTGSLPTAQDDVYIAVPNPIIVTHASGTHTIRNLYSENAVTLSGGTLSVSGTVQVNNAFLLSGGTLANATVLGGSGGQPLQGTTSGGTLDSVTLTATLSMAGGNFHIRNGLTLSNSLIYLDSSAGKAYNQVYYDGDQSITGTGQVYLSWSPNGFNGSILAGVAGSRLTVGPNVFIHGLAGSIGNGPGAVTALGPIRQDGSSGYLTLGGIGSSWRGTVEAPAGGTLTVQGAWQNSGSISTVGGTVNLYGIYSNTGVITLTSGLLYLNNAFTNTGTINTISSSVYYNGDISNTGVMNALSGTVILNGPSFTLASLGNLAYTPGTVSLGGKLNNTGQTLLLDSTTGDWRLAGGTILGGRIATSGTAHLVPTAPGVGTLDGVTLLSNIAVTSAPYTSVSIKIRNGLTLSNATVTLGLPSPTVFTVQMFYEGDQTITGTGEIIYGYSGPSSIAPSIGGTRLTIGPGVTVHGGLGTLGTASGAVTALGPIREDSASGQLTLDGAGSVWGGAIDAPNGGGVTLQGNYNLTGTLTMTNGTLSLGGVFSNSGAIRTVSSTVKLAGAAFRMADLGTFSYTPGSIQLTGVLSDTGNTVTLDASTGDWQLVGGTLRGVRVNGPGRLIGTSSDGTLNGVTLSTTLAMTGTALASTVHFTNGLALNNATILIGAPAGVCCAGNLVFAGDATITGTGEVVFGSVAANSLTPAAGGARLTVGPGVTVHGASGHVSSNAGYLINQGVIRADVAGGTISLDGVAWVNTGLIEAVNGGKLAALNSGANGGTLNPGAAPGTLSLTGNYTQLPTGTLVIPISGTQNGRLNISAAATLSGALVISLTNGTAPNLGDSFTIMTFVSSTGQFATVTGTAIAAGKQFQVNYGATAITLSVVTALNALGAPASAPASVVFGTPDALVILPLGGRPHVMAMPEKRPAWTPAVQEGTLPAAWMETLIDIVRAQRFSPPVAARLYAYTGIALYEGARPGLPGYRSLGGQLRDMPAMPEPQAGLAYDWPTASAAAAQVVIEGLLLRPWPVTRQQLEVLILQQMSQRSLVSSPVALLHALEYGKSVGRAILSWAEHDQFQATRGLIYVMPEGDPSYWVARDGQRPLEPYWGRLRTFALTAADACDVPLEIPFSTGKASVFYAQALEVLTTTQGLTAEQKAIADFWSDGAGLTGTPGGHWISIANQQVRSRNVSFDKAVELYALLGAALGDAFISGWETKYRLLLIRPDTYIARYIDAGWSPYLVTPAFPEYPSGHSVGSGAAAEVLTQLLGPEAYTDYTHHDDLKLPARTFASFWDAANEAAMSRLYGGIHFRAAIINGLEQGKCVGAGVMAGIDIGQHPAANR